MKYRLSVWQAVVSFTYFRCSSAITLMRFTFCARLIAFAVVAMYCSGCTFEISGEWFFGGYAELAERSMATLHSSLETRDPGSFFQASGSLYSFTPLGTYEGSYRWSMRRYDHAFHMLDSSAFPMSDDEQPIGFFRCGKRLLLLAEDHEGDSLKLVGRWFDSSGVQSDRVILISRVLEGDGERWEKDPYVVSSSSDSTHFLVRNKAYWEDEARENGVIFENSFWTFDSHLQMLQSKTMLSSNATVVKTAQIDNSGILYIVREGENNDLFVDRYASDADSRTIAVPIPDFDTLQADVGSAFLVPENENIGYLFSVVRVGKSVNMKELHIHLCDWNTGTAKMITNYGTGTDVAQRITNDVTMGDFRLQYVYTIPQGFVIWAECLADTIITTHTRRGSSFRTAMLYGGTTGLFAFDKQGRLLWQRGFAQKEVLSIYKDKKPFSYITIANDTLCVLKLVRDKEYNITHIFGFRSDLILHTVSLKTGQTGIPVPLLTFYGLARVTNEEFWCVDRKNILIPCYEPDKQMTRLMHLRL